jgi:hypothetical protein
MWSSRGGVLRFSTSSRSTFPSVRFECKVESVARGCADSTGMQRNCLHCFGLSNCLLSCDIFVLFSGTATDLSEYRSTYSSFSSNFQPWHVLYETLPFPKTE